MIAPIHAGYKLFDGLWLVAGGNKFGDEAEFHLVKIANGGIAIP